MRVAVLDPSCINWLYTHNLCQGLVSQGCEVHAVASQFLYLDRVTAGSYKKWDHFYNYTTRLYHRKPRGFLRHYVKGVEHVIDMLTLRNFLKSIKPDIIHFQQTPIPLFDHWILGSLRKLAPLVSTVHNTKPFHGDARWVQLAGFGSFLSRFDRLIAHTEYSRRQLVTELGIPDQRIFVIPGGLYDHYEKLAEHPKPSSRQAEKEQVILFFGNISFYKGPDLLIRAIAQLPKERLKKIRLMICGNPQMSIEPMKLLARELQVEDRITWDLRFIPEEEVHGVFMRSDIVALPHRHIDRSGVLLTALKYGRPIVASRIGGFAEILRDGVHGRLVESENPAALAQGLEAVLADSNKAREMGDAVRTLGQTWLSWDDVAKQTVQIYEGLCSTRSDSRG